MAEAVTQFNDALGVDDMDVDGGAAAATGDVQDGSKKAKKKKSKKRDSVCCSCPSPRPLQRVPTMLAEHAYFSYWWHVNKEASQL